LGLFPPPSIYFAVTEFQFALFNMKSCILWGAEKIWPLGACVLYQRRNAWSRICVIFILHLGRIYSSPPFVLLVKYQSHSNCHSLNCSYLTHIDLQTPQKPLVSSAALSGVSNCPGVCRRCWPGCVASHRLSQQPWRIYLQGACPCSYKVWFYK